MTQTNQRQQTGPNRDSSLADDVSTNPTTSLRPTTDSMSDNDASEKPVREKLKKTSLASMSGHIIGRQERAHKANDEDYTPDHMHRDSSPEKETYKGAGGPRGRPVKKRSFDDLDSPEMEGAEGGREHGVKPNTNGHLRKRSRDVRVGEIPKEDRPPLQGITAVREELEDAASGVGINQASINGSKNVVDSVLPATETLSQVEMEQDENHQDINGPVQDVSGTVHQHDVAETKKESADQEMRDPASSPRKKRSRDQFDTEVDREQKIPATDEARAHRRSDELERSEDSAVRNRSSVSPEGSRAAEKKPVIVEEEKSLVDTHIGGGRQEVGRCPPMQSF